MIDTNGTVKDIDKTTDDDIIVEDRKAIMAYEKSKVN